MTTNSTKIAGAVIREDEGGGGTSSGRGGTTAAAFISPNQRLTEGRIQDHARLTDYETAIMDGQQSLDIFVRHCSLQLKREQQRCSQTASTSRPSMLNDAIELPTLNGVVMRRKQQFQHRYEHQQAIHKSSTTSAILTTTANQPSVSSGANSGSSNKARPLSISSISSAASSGSNSSNNSSTSSGIQSSLTRNGSLNYGHDYRKHAYLASIESLNSSSAGNETGGIEAELKHLKLSPSVQLKNAAARAAVLAAGAQSRGFNTPGNRISRINRSFHASLRYDKTTAHRIHNSMATARDLMNISQTCGDNDQQQQREGSVSRNNSSTSSDGGNRRRASTKLQPSPSSASSNSNTSSLFRDDGFEDDLTSTTSERTSSYQAHRRLSFQGRDQSMHRYHPNRAADDDDDEYQSCEEDFSNSRTTASTSDDCALSTTSSSLMQVEQQVLDKISLANAKQQYRKSLLLEHQQKQYLIHSQNKIQALVTPPPPSSISTSTPSNISSSPPKQTKCDDRTVNIIGHMPTRSPGYWDSNLSITQRVVTEIIETERTYVEDLEQIVTGYICYLRNILKQHKRKQSHSLDISFDEDIISSNNELEEYDAEETENDTIAIKENLSHVSERRTAISNKYSEEKDAIISATHIKKLFSNLEDIYKFNKDLLFRLEECYLNPSSVAECFVENSAGFEVYTHYCTMYPQVVSTLTELMSDPTSAQLFRERQNELNQSLPLGAYLLKPVQRILKYHILFQSLIKHTSEDDSVNEKDRQLINEAFSVMTSIACHINAMKRRHEHAIRVQEIQGLLSDWEGPDLTTFGELILEDTFKLFNRPKSTRHIFLFDNVLLITKKKRDGSLCYKGHIACSNLMLIENIEGHPLVFNTVPFDNPKALCAFQAKTLDKKRDWCLHIKDMIIKSFEVKIPVHVKDILMGLTNSSSTETSSSKSTAVRAPNYLERKRSKPDRKK